MPDIPRLPFRRSDRLNQVWRRRFADRETRWRLAVLRRDRTIASLEANPRPSRRSRRTADVHGDDLARIEDEIVALEEVNVVRLLDAARKSLDAGDTASTRRSIAEVLGIDPHHHDGLTALVELEVAEGNTDGALDTVAHLRLIADTPDLVERQRTLRSELFSDSDRTAPATTSPRPWAAIDALPDPTVGRILVFPPAPASDFYDLTYRGLHRSGVETVAPTHFDADALHAHAGRPRTAVHVHWTGWLDARRGGPGIAAFLSAAAPAPVIWTMHNAAPHDIDEDPAIREQLHAHAAVIHVMHPEAADNLISHDLSVASVVRIPHPSYVGAIPTALPVGVARRRLHLDDSAFVAAAIGQIRPYRGLDLLAPAIDAMDGDLEVLVAGEPQPDAAGLSLVRGLQRLAPVRLYPGHATDTELVTFLSAADVAVLPYREVLNSGAALYALTCGTPLVVPASPAFAWLEPFDVMEQFEPGDARSLGAALDRARRFRADTGLPARVDAALDGRTVDDIGDRLADEVLGRLGW